MENLTGGIIVIVFCIIGFFFSWKFFKKEEYKKSLFLIILCGLLLRIFVGLDFYLHEWDERYHALVAKNLIKHPLKPTLYDEPLFPYDYKEWSGNHVWLAKPPMPLWLMAASIYFFGNNEIAVRIPSFLLSTAAIYLTFLIGYLLFNNKIGLLAAFLHSIHGSLIELAGGRISSDHVETCFVFFVELSILCSILAVKRNNIMWTVFTGIFTGVAFLSKWMPSLIVIPIWTFLMYNAKTASIKKIFSDGFILLFFFLLIAVPWHIFTFKKYPAEASLMFDSFFKPLAEIIQEHNGPPWYYLKYLRVNFGEIIYIPLIWFLWKIIKKKLNYKMLTVFLWLFIPILVFSIAETKRQTYMLITAPAFFIATSYFFYYCYFIRKKFRYQWLIIMVMFLLIALPVRYSFERTKPFEKRERNPVWAQKLRKLNQTIKGKNIVLFNIERPVEAMFYTDFIVYAHIPENEQIKNLIERGYKVIINDNGLLNQTTKDINGLEIITL